MSSRVKKTPEEKHFFCREHREYRAKVMPNCDCDICWSMWFIRVSSNLELSVSEAAEEVRRYDVIRQNRWAKLRKESAPRWQPHEFSVGLKGRCAHCGQVPQCVIHTNRYEPETLQHTDRGAAPLS